MHACSSWLSLIIAVTLSLLRPVSAVSHILRVEGQKGQNVRTKSETNHMLSQPQTSLCLGLVGG